MYFERIILVAMKRMDRVGNRISHKTIVIISNPVTTEMAKELALGYIWKVSLQDLSVDGEGVRAVRKPYPDRLWGLGPITFLLEGPLGFLQDSPNLFQGLHWVTE